MSKVCAISDIHLSSYQDDKLNDTLNLPERLAITIFACQGVAEYARKIDSKDVFILGDLYNDKDIIYTDSQNAFIQLVIRKYSDLRFHIISGNHDYSSTGENRTSCISALQAYENVYCYFEPTVIENITLVPYYDNIFEIIQKQKTTDILFSHFGVTEAKMQSGISVKSPIGLKDLRRFKLTVLGHYHCPQSISFGESILYYIGSPVHLTWNDKNEQKRFLVIDTKTLEVESVNLDGFRCYYEFVIDKTNRHKLNEYLELAKQLKSHGNYVRIRNVSEETIKENEDLVVIEEKTVDVANRGISISMTQKERLKKYLDYREIPEQEQDRYLEPILQIMEGVN